MSGCKECADLRAKVARNRERFEALQQVARDQRTMIARLQGEIAGMRSAAPASADDIFRSMFGRGR